MLLSVLINSAKKVIPLSIQGLLLPTYHKIALRFGRDHIETSRSEKITEISLGFTLRCLAACPHCYLLQDDPDTFKTPVKDVSRELVEQIFDSPCVRDITSLSCTGGEALTHPEFFELLDIPIAKGVRNIQVISNGSAFRNDATIDQVVENQRKLNNIHISLDALDLNTYLEVKGIKKADFEKMLGNIRRVAEATKNNPSFSIGTSFVIHEDNIARAKEMIEFAVSLEVDYCHLASLHVTGKKGTSFDKHTITTLPEEYRHIMAKTDYPISITIQAPIEDEFLGYYCPSLSEHLSVGPSGLLAPCCHMPWKAVCGKFQDAPTDPINNELAVDMRRAFIDAYKKRDPELLPKNCRSCNKRLKGTYKFNVLRKDWSFIRV